MLTGQWVIPGGIRPRRRLRNKKISLSFWLRPILAHGRAKNCTTRSAIMAIGSLFLCMESPCTPDPAPLRPLRSTLSWTLPGRGDPNAFVEKRFSCFKFRAPIIIVQTADAKLALGIHLQTAGLAAYREGALAAKGLEIAHLQFVFHGLTLAVCSRVRRDGIVEIEMGLGDPRLPKSAFTAAQMRQAEAASRVRSAAGHRGRPARVH